MLRLLTLLLLAATLAEPIVPPGGPCHSETPWGCQPVNIWLPLISN